LYVTFPPAFVFKEITTSVFGLVAVIPTKALPKEEPYDGGTFELGGTADLTGSIIVANSEIAVQSGSGCAKVPTGSRLFFGKTENPSYPNGSLYSALNAVFDEVMAYIPLFSNVFSLTKNSGGTVMILVVPFSDTFKQIPISGLNRTIQLTDNEDTG
jgi:hypothetical protein